MKRWEIEFPTDNTHKYRKRTQREDDQEKNNPKKPKNKIKQNNNSKNYSNFDHYNANRQEALTGYR